MALTSLLISNTEISVVLALVVGLTLGMTTKFTIIKLRNKVLPRILNDYYEPRMIIDSLNRAYLEKDSLESIIQQTRDALERVIGPTQISISSKKTKAGHFIAKPVLTVPLTVRGKEVALLKVQKRAPSKLTKKDCELVGIISNNLAAAIDSSINYKN